MGASESKTDSATAAPPISSSGPVRVAAADDDTDEESGEHGGGPVPAPDPRVAARGPGFYTPPSESTEPGKDDEPREGVA